MTIIYAGDLTLRAVEKADAPRFAFLCNDESLARFTSRIPHPYTLEYARDFVERAAQEMDDGKEYRFAVCLDGEIIGCTGVTPGEEGVYDLGYWVGADYRGKGVASAAAGAVIALLFERYDARVITAGHFVDNPASGHILQKLGFQPTGETKQLMSIARGVEVETILFALEQADFRKPLSIRFDP